LYQKQAKDASRKKRKFNSLGQIDGEEESESASSTSKIFKSKSTDGVQATLNQIKYTREVMKKKLMLKLLNFSTQVSSCSILLEIQLLQKCVT